MVRKSALPDSEVVRIEKMLEDYDPAVVINRTGYSAPTIYKISKGRHPVQLARKGNSADPQPNGVSVKTEHCLIHAGAKLPCILCVAARRQRASLA